MYHIRTVVEILNNDLEKVAEVKALYPLNREGTIIRYSRELSDYGRCTFRVSTKDNILTELGDIFKPHTYHVRLKRANATVWQGVIVDNTERNRNYVEIVAFEYLYYFSKILIRRTENDPETSPSYNLYRVFNSGTMATAVQNVFTQAIADFGTNHPLATATTGTIDNPNYPKNFYDSNGNQLTGGWTFTPDVALQFDFHSALYVFKAFGIYSNSDFELTESLDFNFKNLIGNRISGITFQYGTVGTNIVDYNVPRFGGRMVNDLTGIATSEEGIILHSNPQRDNSLVDSYGLLQETRAYSDVKNQNFLNSRTTEEVRLIKDPEESPINLVLDEKAYPLGQYGLGDIVWIKIKDHIIDFQKERRIVGFTVNVHNTGRELIVVQTNKPQDTLVGAS